MRTGNAVETYSGLVALSTNPVVWFWVSILLAGLLLLPMVLTGHLLVVATNILIAAVGAIGLNLLTGSTGLISLGQSAFLLIGAYSCALLIADYGWKPELAFVASGVIASACSLLIGVPSLRLKGLYLAITTLAFSFIVSHVVLYAEPVTHGPFGVRIPNVSVFGIDIAKTGGLYYLSLAATIIATLFALNLMRTRVGRAWTALRDHDIAAKTMGINLVRYKLLAFMVSSALVGYAGALMAFQIRFINVDVFSVFLSVEALAIILVGGVGSVGGAILGAVFLVLLPEAVRAGLDLLGPAFASSYSTYVFEIRSVVTGLMIILVLRLEPEGMMGLWRRLRRFWGNWPLSV
jgi:branched-chain amino acid transport system permease protein